MPPRHLGHSVAVDDLTPDRHRTLTRNERAVLEATLARSDGPGMDRLRAQVATARVTGGKPYALELRVDAGLRAPDIPNGPLRARPWAHDEKGEALGTVSVWIADGYLSSIDFGWVTDTTPTELPPAEWLRFE